ncbi:hypothetical protein OAJ77_00760 [Rhodospirillales bacterium]|nr:hypothetical protein [Rhodospirillales bacterium]
MTRKPPDIDFVLRRPFIQFSGDEILAAIEAHILTDVANIEIATLALDELKLRKKAKRITLAQKLFRSAGFKPIPWLQSARDSLTILERPKKGNYQGHLYVVLIEGYTKTNKYYGAYVGSSRYRPETRFKQHKEGKHASNIVNRRGLHPLQSLLWPWQTVPGGKTERILWESALNRCLDQVIPKVSGDFRPSGEWPSEFQRPLQAILNKTAGNNTLVL